MADTSRVWGLHKPTYTWWDLKWPLGEHSKSQTCTEIGPIGCQVEIIRVHTLVSSLKGKHCSQKVLDVLHKNISRLYSSFQWIGFHGKFLTGKPHRSSWENRWFPVKIFP